MEKVRIFTSKNIDDLQKKINDWLANKGGKIKITSRLQSSSSSPGGPDVVISIFYTKK